MSAFRNQKVQVNARLMSNTLPRFILDMYLYSLRESLQMSAAMRSPEQQSGA